MPIRPLDNCSDKTIWILDTDSPPFRDHLNTRHRSPLFKSPLYLVKNHLNTEPIRYLDPTVIITRIVSWVPVIFQGIIVIANSRSFLDNFGSFSTIQSQGTFVQRISGQQLPWIQIKQAWMLHSHFEPFKQHCALLTFRLSTVQNICHGLFEYQTAWESVKAVPNH